MASFPICLLSKASKTKSWLWHQHLSHLNFGTINHLARNGLVQGLPKLKFKKYHLCFAYAMGKSKKKPYKPKSKDINQENLYLLHMDLCVPMRVASVNEKKYILVIVEVYSRFTWVKCLRSKDEALDFIIKFLKMIQVRLKTSVYESKKAEVVAIACYTQNRSIIRLHHGKTPYELLHDKLPDLPFFHVFGALCYPINDSENLGKLQPKADIDFDDVTAMASEHNSSGPTLYEMTRVTISSGLVLNPPPSTMVVPTLRTNWDILFQLMFDELLTPPPSVDYPSLEVIAPIADVVTPEPTASTSSPSSTTIDQDVPSHSNSQISPETQTPVISNDVEEDNHDLDVAHMNNDPFFGVDESPKTPTFHDDPLHESLHEDSTSQGSSSNMRQTYTPFESHVEPKNFKQSMTEPSWIDAIHEEIYEFKRLQFWELLKWIYKVKTDEFCGVLKNKARLVAQGFRQEEEGFVDQENPSHVYKLKKALYGLKQALCAWYDMLSCFLISQHFSKGAVTPTLFTRKAMNDLLLVKPTEKQLNAVKQDTRCSTLGSAQFICDKLVSWSFKKQKCTAISSTKAEYYALSGCCAQILWIRSQLTDYGFQFNKIPMYCDNKSVENGIVELYFIWTEYQLDDIFTKPLPRARSNFLIEKLGIKKMSPDTLKRLAEETDE
nr:integrase, catalytic region, zinc finger, CCHC-type, peptidase aspartic, catalytic [Tanacetum cinerariifolium]